MSNPLDRNTIRELVREAVEKQEALAAAPALPNSNQVDESLKDVITEAEVQAVPAGGSLLIREDAIITPSAQDLIRGLRLTVNYRKRLHFRIFGAKKQISTPCFLYYSQKCQSSCLTSI